MDRLIFDTHAHYTSGSFNKYRETLLENLPKQGVALVLDCATDFASSLECIKLADAYDYIYVAAGIHPESLIDERASTVKQFKGDWQAEMKAIRPLYEHPKVVAVGEVGLDHHWPVPKDEQLRLFEAEIKTAMEFDLPLSMHDREAHAEMYALLKKYKPKGVLHAFSGSVDDAKWLCAQGIYIGLGGPVTYKNAQRPKEVAAAVPDDKLLVETDCPYMAPEPMRGKKCDSSMIRFTAKQIAALRGCCTDEVLKLTMDNGKRLFGIK